MAKDPVGGLHVLLDLTTLNTDEKARDALISTIIKMAPNSKLFGANATIQAEVGNLTTLQAAYKTASSAASASAQQAQLDAAAAVKAKNVCNRSISLLRTLTENDAADASDITSMGFTPYQGAPPAPAMDPPAQIDVKPGKKGSGSATATVHETGPTRRAYAAEGSTDGGVTWFALPGNGKSRKLTGKPGTSMQVRFALVRGRVSSPWSQPVVVTFP